MVLIAVLIKCDEKIGFIAGRKHFTGTDPDLEDRRSTRNRGRNRHVSHDVVIAASGQTRQKCARGLNSVLRISGETNYSILDVFRTQIGAGRRAGWSAVRSIGFWQNRS